MRTSRLLSTVAAVSLGVSGLLLAAPGVANAVVCPTVDPVTRAVSPAPTPGVNWSGCAMAFADLGDANLSGANLAHTTLQQATLAGADLTGADLSGANLYYAFVPDANLTGATLVGADLSRVWTDLSGANLTLADLSDANLTGAELYGAYLTGADLTGADLTSTVLQRASLSRANLTGARLYGTDLNHTDLPDANLTDADLAGAYLYDTDLSGANLTRANLTSAGGCCNDLFGATLTGATVSGDFTLSTLASADLTDAVLAGADLDGATGCGIVGRGYTLPTGFSIVAGCLAFTGVYSVSPFGAPVDNPPTVNVAVAGRIVPFNFSVAYPSGQPVRWLSTANPSSWARTCPSGATRDPLEWYTKARPQLVNLGGGAYRYNFQTKDAWAGTCRTLRISLGDGVQHTAIFKFTR